MTEPLTREQVAAIRANLTMGDLEAVRGEVAEGDAEQLAKRAMHRRAQKLGYVNGADYADFLDLVRVDDLAAIFGTDAANPTRAGTPALPASATSGE